MYILYTYYYIVIMYMLEKTERKKLSNILNIDTIFS